MPDVAKSAPEAKEPTPEPVVEAPVKVETRDHVAIRDFAARYAHQVLHFKKDEVIDPDVGAALRAAGAPIRLVEQLVKEIKGKL